MDHDNHYERYIANRRRRLVQTLIHEFGFFQYSLADLHLGLLLHECEYERTHSDLFLSKSLGEYK